MRRASGLSDRSPKNLKQKKTKKRSNKGGVLSVLFGGWSSPRDALARAPRRGDAWTATNVTAWNWSAQMKHFTSRAGRAARRVADNPEP